MLTHGEAVGLGLVAAARLSELGGFALPGLADRVEALVSRVGLATSLPTAMPVDALVEAMHRDKKRQGGKLRFVLMRDIGDPFVADDVTPSALDKVLVSLQPA